MNNSSNLSAKCLNYFSHTDNEPIILPTITRQAMLHVPLLTESINNIYGGSLYAFIILLHVLQYRNMSKFRAREDSSDRSTVVLAAASTFVLQQH